MRVAGLAVLSLSCALGAETVEAFGRRWTVPVSAEWNVSRSGRTEVLALRTARGPEPPPAPRRPRQFALADTRPWQRVTVDAEVKPLGRSLIVVFAWQDDAHFNYAHISTDIESPHHNGIFHVYGGERVRISPRRGPAALRESNTWYRVRLTHDASSGIVAVTVNGRPVPALNAVDLSLGAGRVGLGSFDETAEFRNVRITGTAARAVSAPDEMPVATEQPAP